MSDRGTSLRRAWARFADANRRPAATYDEGSALEYPPAPLASRFALTKSRRSLARTEWVNHLASATVRIDRATDLSARTLRLQLDLPNRNRGSGAVATVFPTTGRAGDHPDRRCPRPATPTVSIPFGRDVEHVEVTLANAGIHYRCWRGSAYSCRGRSQDDDLPFLLRADRAALTSEVSLRASRRRVSACRATAGSVVVHIGGRLALRNPPYLAVASRGSRTATTPRSVCGADQSTRALSEQQRGVRRGDLHEAVAAGLVGGLLPGAEQRVVGTRERDPVDQHQLAGVAGDVEPLPQAEGAEQAGVRVADELRRQLRQLGVALGERGEVRQPLAHHLGGGLGRAPRREQPEGAALCGVDRARRSRRASACAIPSRPGGGRCLATYRIACRP